MLVFYPKFLIFWFKTFFSNSKFLIFYPKFSGNVNPKFSHSKKSLISHPKSLRNSPKIATNTRANTNFNIFAAQKSTSFCRTFTSLLNPDRQKYTPNQNPSSIRFQLRKKTCFFWVGDHSVVFTNQLLILRSQLKLGQWLRRGRSPVFYKKNVVS